MFPEIKGEHGEITLIKGKDWEDAQKLASKEKLNKFIWVLPSWYRNISLMDSLQEMDLIRAKLIKNKNYRAVFYSHISHEFNIAEKKFKLFLKQ